MTRAPTSTLGSCQANEEAFAERLDEFIVKLKELKQVASPFTLVSMEGVEGPGCQRGETIRTVWDFPLWCLRRLMVGGGLYVAYNYPSPVR